MNSGCNKLLSHFLKQQRTPGDKFCCLEAAGINHAVNGLGLICMHPVLDALLPNTAVLLSVLFVERW
jgi:hypothetical protein